MRKSVTFRKSTGVVATLAIFILLFTTCISREKEKSRDTANEPAAPSPMRADFSKWVGSEKCATCHAKIFSDYSHTSHYLTSRPASEKTIRGSFAKGKNVYEYNPELFIKMEKRDSGLYQVVYYKGQEKIAIPFDITVGSGTKGQSFMYWHNTGLFQTPMTYYTIPGRWANSPGFPSKVQYERPITSRCMECHTTYADVISPWPQTPEQFDRNKIIYGVGCEKCHGPAARHVDFFTSHPTEKGARYIINPKTLSRQQVMDLCALCHGGRKQKTQPSFTFTAGDTLTDFFRDDPTNTALQQPGIADVHGNQAGVLMASQCYIRSKTMTCLTCHDSHKNERNETAVFTGRCQTCHQEVHKAIPGASELSTVQLKNNCVTCHMPVSASRSIVLYTSGMESPKAALFRTHYISVYPDVTRQFLQGIKKQSGR